MKLVVLLALPATALAASWASVFQGSHLEGGELTSTVSTEDMNGCIADADKFLSKPSDKHRAIEHAMDHCALSRKVDDKNFVCPHYRQLLNAAFMREPTDRKFTSKSFCAVSEGYVKDLRSAAKIPNMGKGSGAKFILGKDCKPIVSASLAPAKTLPSRSAPDFWYALCMNQDCAHFLPSRTRWCTQNHQPTHTASVCEAVRLFAHDEVSVFGKKELNADEVCGMYSEFVEDSHINVEAYMHVVHGKPHHVPSPENKDRALASAKMKNDAKGHGIRDAAGDPVKSFAATMVPAGLVLALAGFAGF